jgi:NAD(P)-dependent dehydrogenase (short-subunit alcohol dehydrogenase family)
MNDLPGKAVVITGAARGLGLSYARHLTASGASVVVNDIDVAATEQAVRELRAAGRAAVSCTGSVADPATADRLVETCLAEFGRIDGLVNNAGIRPEGLSWREDPGLTRRAVEVNVLGTMYCGAAAIAAMDGQGGGSIVNVSSRAQTGIERSATYSATKGAVASLTYSWAIDAPDGVRVNAIAPQARGTGTRRQGVPSRPEEPEPGMMAPLVTYLISDASKLISGQVIRLIGQPAGLALGLVRHPRGSRLLVKPGGWSTADLSVAFDQVLGPELEPVGATPQPSAYIRTGDFAVTVL